MSSFDTTILRELFRQALPEESSLYGSSPEPRFVYLPASHVKALRPDTMVVSGMRGAGKSFWWAALQSPQIRTLVSTIAPHVDVKQNTEIKVGFGERPEPDSYPDRDVLSKLLRDGIEPRLIWRTVVIHKLVPPEHPVSNGNWISRICWIKDNPELVSHLLSERDREFERGQMWFLVLFDALDRSASNWQDMHKLIRGLLETALDFRPYRRLRVKCFLRTDQLDESRVANFPDASKVLSSKVELSWQPLDLYGLLLQYIANSDFCESVNFKEIAERVYGIEWVENQLGGSSIWRMAPKVSEASLRQLLHAITGPWMGRSHKRGFPYSWIPGHLADSYGRISPRSFLAALREAVDDTIENYPHHEWTLHYESIKRGVQTASRIRVRELKEDYSWVDLLMEPLQGLVVPCSFDEVVSRWTESDALQKIEREVNSQEIRLVPSHWQDGPSGIRLDMEDLGIFVRMLDGRVNIPDVFRVGYGLGRKGGVPPVRKNKTP